jgi:class 3 adenylate cyclase
MEQRSVFLVLIDISGYTRFTKLHRLSAMHAEQIVSDLLESIIKRSRHPLVVHEILGDSVNFFAYADGGREAAIEVRRQVADIFDAFRLREGELISDCSLCVCQACVNVGKLHLKAVLHYGQAVFTNIAGFRKIAGEDVIMAHRLLKNSVPEREYVLETEAFHEMAGASPGVKQEARTEHYEDLGEVRIRVSYLSDQSGPAKGTRRSLMSKLRMSLRNDVYYLKRLFGRPERPFQNLNFGAPPPISPTALFAAKTHLTQMDTKRD